MATPIGPTLLRQYNEDDDKKIVDVRADDPKGLASWSYANPYDALYNQYKNDKNFNQRLWHEAVSRGEQDNYLVFLEKNKNNNLSSEFYDPQYYDYESMMLELYLPLANRENEESRKRNVFDQVNHKWVEEDLGKMSDYDYLLYQIQESRNITAAQIQRQLDQDHKNEQNFWQNLGTHGAAVGMEVGEGIISALAGIADVFGALGYASASNISDAAQNKNMSKSWGDYFVEYYANGLTAMEKESLRTRLDEYERTHTYFRDVDGNMTGWGTYIASVANSIGNMIPSIVANLATGGLASSASALAGVAGAIGPTMFYASIFSHNMYENASDENLVDTPAWNKILNAGAKAGAEAVIEYALGKVLGGTIQNQMLGIKGRARSVLPAIGKWTGAKYLVKSALQEGLEEFMQDWGTSCVDTLMGFWHEGYAKRADGVNIQTLVDSFFAGVISSLVLSGTSIGIDSTRSLIVNSKARKNAIYENAEILPGDMVVERKTTVAKKDANGNDLKDKDGKIITEDKIELVKVHGWNRLYLKSVLSELQGVLHDLHKGHRRSGNNVKLAQEAYAAVNALTQYYAGFDKTRLENCEKFLNRMLNTNESDFAEEFDRASEISLSPIDLENRMNAPAEHARIDLATELSTQVFAMTNYLSVEARRKLRDDAKKAVEEKHDEFAENGVTKFKGVKSAKKETDTDVQEAIADLNKSAQLTLDEMAKDYPVVLVSDGHYAADMGEIAFVSESWLENYSADEIYEFMLQTKLIDTLKEIKDYQPMIADLVKFVREFTGKVDVNSTRAITEFLFNSNIYQGFLLSNNGERVHKYKKFIFRIQETVLQIANDSDYVQQRFGKSKMPSQKRANLVRKLYDRIRNTWRIPTVKAILNWGFDPADIGANTILSPRDKEFVKEIKRHNDSLAEPVTGNVTQAHINLAEDLISLGLFTDEEIAIIRKGRGKDANDDERLMSRMFLDLVDEFRQPKNTSSQTIVLPPAAISHVQDPATAQWIADKLKEFESRYGISAEQMISGVLFGMTNEQRLLLEEDMRISGYDNVATFVPAKLESMLGSEYVAVIPYDKNFVTSTLSVADFNKAVDIDQQNLVVEKFRSFMRDAALVKDWLEYHSIGKRMTSAQYDELIEDFENLAGMLLDKKSEYHAYLPKRFLQWLDSYNYFLKIGGTSETIYRHILNGKSIIVEAIDEIIKRFGVIGQTNLPGIRIAKKIETDKFLPSYFRSANMYARNEAIRNTYKQRIEDHYVSELFYWNNFFAAEYGMSKMEKLSDAEFMAEVMSRTPLYELLNELRGDVSVNPFTGEILEGDTLKERDFLIKVLENVEIIDNCYLTDFIDVSNFSDDFKSFCGTIQVSFSEFSSKNTQGSYNPLTNTITLSSTANDLVSSLVHEFNHAIQHNYNMSFGGSAKEFLFAPDLMNYIVKNYRPLVDFVLRITRSPEITDTNFKNFPFRTKNALSYLAYRMLAGEMHASEASHNTNVVGFRRIREGSHDYYLAPDNHTRFRSLFDRTNFNENLPDESTSLTPAMAKAMEDVYFKDFMKILLAKQEADEFAGDSDYIRGTFHTRANRINPYEVLYGVIDPSLKIKVLTAGISIDDIIHDPEIYLSQEVLGTLNGDYSEGNVFYKLKEYIEEHFEGASLDRDSRTHQVILVDDNAYDDLLKVSMLSASTDLDSTSLYKNYANTEGISLSTFYKESELKRLGIDPDIKVIISPNVKSEAIRDKNNPRGVIHIQASESYSDAAIIYRLNHEFRHLMQLYNNLETGFTPNFDVTSEMIEDVKKHVPELFKNRDVKMWAQQRAKRLNRSVDETLVQMYVYHMTGGEVNAHGFSNLALGTKPIYATYEAGNPTIFMPWYDAKTGEGRHKTKYLAMRSESAGGKKLKGLEGLLPPVKKKEKDTRPRYFSTKSAIGTNLIYYVKSGQMNQLDPQMQDFVKATTGHLDKLPPELKHHIEQGQLTRQRLISWFDSVDSKKINDFTFKLMNKYIFKNDTVVSLEDLENVLNDDYSLYYGVALSLAAGGAPLESLIKTNDLDIFKRQIRRAESWELYEKIKKRSSRYWNLTYPNGFTERMAIADEKFLRGQRSFIMNFFDGSLASAFYLSFGMKKALTLYRYSEQSKNHEESLNRSTTDVNTDDQEQTLIDAMTEDDSVFNSAEATDREVANDILAAYELAQKDKDSFINELIVPFWQHNMNDMIDGLKLSEDKEKDLARKALMKKELSNLKAFERKVDELYSKSTLSEKEQKQLKRFTYYERRLNEFKKKTAEQLEALPIEELKARAAIYAISVKYGKELDTGIFDINNRFSHVLSIDTQADTDVEQDPYLAKRRPVLNNRARLVGRIREAAMKLNNYILNDRVKIDDLPDDIKDMFELVEVEEKGTRRKIKQWSVKRKYYTVGRGRKALPGNENKKRFEKRHFNIDEDTNELYRHDVSKLIELDKRLYVLNKQISEKIRIEKTALQDSEKRIAQLTRKNEQLSKKLAKTMDDNEKYHSVDFRVKKSEKPSDKKSHISDTPNLFSVVSSIEMPEKLREIYDTSFTDFADTRVQFVSRDKDGKVYDKEKMKPGEFDSLVTHEKSNYDKFYEANREKLSKLSRQDVLDIVEFIEKGSITADGPANKLQAFEIYLLAFFVEGARDNLYSWYFSEGEVRQLESLFERKASEAGTALRAVRDVGKIINPLRKFKEMLFADFEIFKDGQNQEELDELIDAIDAGRTNEAKAEQALARLKEVLKEEATRRRELYGVNVRWSKAWIKSLFKYDKIKSFRMWSMLSSPATAVKNLVSNVTATGINGFANVIAKMTLGKKAYRKDQWDLSRRQVSPEVKAFIAEEIKNNPLFDALYNTGSKYDPRKRAEDDTVKANFTTLVVAAMEREYAANYHFDGTQKSFLSKLVGRAMSDSAFVKRAALKYYSKMLTIEVEAGNIDLRNGLKSSALNLFADAVVLASRDYMHKRSAVADAMDSIVAEHPALREAMLFFFPFINSSFNWWEENFFKLTPFGLGVAIYKFKHLEQEIAKVEAMREKGLMVPSSRMTEYLIRRDIGKGIAGMIFWLIGAILAFSGGIRIDEEEDKLFAYIQDIKVDISAIFGSSSLLVGAAITQMFIKQSDGDTMSFMDSMAQCFNVLLDGFFVTDFMERYRFSDGAFGMLMTASEDAMKSFVPQFVQFAVSLTNNKRIKYSPGIKGGIERWLNSWVPAQPFGNYVVNPYTGEREIKYAVPVWDQWLQKGIFGPKIFRTVITEEERMCRELGVNRNELTGEMTVNDEKVMLDRDVLNVKYGELNKAKLAKIKSQKHKVEMPNGKYKTLPWDELSDKQKANVLNRVMDNNAKYAKIYTWTQSGHKYYASTSEFKELRLLGITQNVYKGDKGFVE